MTSTADVTTVGAVTAVGDSRDLEWWEERGGDGGGGPALGG